VAGQVEDPDSRRGEWAAEVLVEDDALAQAGPGPDDRLAAFDDEGVDALRVRRPLAEGEEVDRQRTGEVAGPACLVRPDIDLVEPVRLHREGPAHPGDAGDQPAIVPRWSGRGAHR